MSALLLTSATAFNVIKYAGAAYLIYLGLKTLFNSSKPTTEPTRKEKWSSIFYQGMFVQLLNPKTALFFFSFLPQFVEPEKGSISVQILFFGGVMFVLGAASDLIYAFLAGGAGHFLRENLRFLRTQRYFAGFVYIGLGLTTALSGTNRR